MVLGQLQGNVRYKAASAIHHPRLAASRNIYTYLAAIRSRMKVRHGTLIEP